MEGTDPRILPILLAAFADAGEGESVRASLTALGYAVSSWPDPGVRTSSPPDRRAVRVMVVGSSLRHKDELMSLLDATSGQPLLGVFAAAVEHWDTDILDRCDEFSGWPCHRRELSYRLRRIAALTADSAGDAIPPPDIAREFTTFNLIGTSAVFLESLRQVDKIARCDASVLLEGETGTGKDMVARAIHYQGARSDYPFIPVNCGALPDNLIENEFFGHEKGAFTDAAGRHAGLVAQAEGGTLFLDEVDALSARGQVTLLRFLESQEYRPLGGRRPHRADVRVIAASNTALGELVQRGGFRQDLYYRLNILSVTLPPLRERDGDVELLARHFMRACQEQYGKEKTLGSRALEWLGLHDWPGNVRELENLLHREYLLAEGALIDLPKPRPPLADFGPGASEGYPGGDFGDAKARAIRRFEREYLRGLMREARGNVSLAARLAGKERRALGKLLKKHNIDRTEFAE